MRNCRRTKRKPLYHGIQCTVFQVKFRGQNPFFQFYDAKYDIGRLKMTWFEDQNINVIFSQSFFSRHLLVVFTKILQRQQSKSRNSLKFEPNPYRDVENFVYDNVKYII